MAKRQSPRKGKEMTKARKTGRAAARILAASYQVPINILAASYQVPINTYQRMINDWKGMTLAKKIGWTVGLILFLSYPLIVFIHFAFLRKTF